jgi:hypothetical protein
MGTQREEIGIRERKILRKIYGAKKEGKECKIRNNQELRDMYGQPDIIAEIKSKRLEWLGNVARMEENRMVKRVFEGHPVEREKLVGLGSDGWMIVSRILD